MICTFSCQEYFFVPFIAKINMIYKKLEILVDQELDGKIYCHTLTNLND